jgi:Zn ribbon nucleic-acid-binding protein
MKSTDINAWYDDIAAKAALERALVEDVLSRHAIKPIIKSAVPQRLRILSLSFTGKKRGLLSTPVAFDWTDLKPGLHAIVSRTNLRGKTTLLKLMQFGLNGNTAPADDIYAWFQTMTMRFALDNDVFETRIDDFAEQRGALISFKNGREFVVAKFEGAASFKATMEAFFLDKLGLHTTRIVVNRGGKDVMQEHGWPWLSSAMSIEPNPENVFGNMKTGGMPTYMMRMYIGLPWVGTHTDIKAAIKSIEMETDRAGQATARNQNSARLRLKELEDKRAALEPKLAGPSTVDQIVSRDRSAMDRLLAISAELHALTRKQTQITEDIQASEEAVTHAIRERHTFDEAQQAGTIFRLLRPEFCPSCDEVFTDEYREERQQHHDCIVCGRHEKDEEDLTGVREGLVEQETEAKVRLAKLKAAQKKLTGSVSAKSAERDTVEAELRRVQDDMRSTDTVGEAWREALKLDAQIEEVRRVLTDAGEPVNHDLKVLKAADAVTQGLFSEDQAGILGDVAKMTATFAKSFGMEMLEKIEFSGVAMKVHKNGATQSFTSCTPGERKRLKIAATLAMVHVAETRGVGRHPGVLFIDSPGADETVDENLEEIVEGLAKLSLVLPNVQVFLTTIANDAVLSHVPCENVRKARDDGWMW